MTFLFVIKSNHQYRGTPMEEEVGCDTCATCDGACCDGCYDIYRVAVDVPLENGKEDTFRYAYLYKGTNKEDAESVYKAFSIDNHMTFDAVITHLLQSGFNIAINDTFEETAAGTLTIDGKIVEPDCCEMEEKIFQRKALYYEPIAAQRHYKLK